MLSKNPFKSEKQRRYLWKFHPEIATRWSDEMKRNPPSPGFEWLDKGSFATIYRSGWRVEAIVKPDNFGLIDLSKDIIVSVRSKVSDNSKRFIPEITRKRIDVDEFIYEMPYYEACDEYHEFDYNKKISEKSVPVEVQIEELGRYFSGMDLLGIIEALLMFRSETARLGLVFGNDFKNRNILKQGDQLILLDTFHAIDLNCNLIKRRWKARSLCRFLSVKQLLKSLTQSR